MEGKIPSQNLIKQVKVESSVGRPSFYKPFVFDVLTVASALFLSYTYRQYLNDKSWVAILLAALVIFAIFSALQVFLTKNLKRRFFVIFLEAVALFGFFYDYNIRLLAVGAGTALGFIFWGEFLGHSELENGLEIKFFKVVKPVLGKTITAVALMFVVIYMPRWSRGETLISKSNFEGVFDWTAGLANNFYPEVDFSSSFGKLSESLARLELQGNAAFKNLPTTNKELAVKKAAEQVMSNLGKNLGLTVSQEESVSGVFYKFVVKFLNEWRNRLSDWFIIGWAFGVFLIIRGLGTIFYWIVAILSLICYQILLSTGFMHIMGETRTHEVVEY